MAIFRLIFALVDGVFITFIVLSIWGISADWAKGDYTDGFDGLFVVIVLILAFEFQKGVRKQ